MEAIQNKRRFVWAMVAAATAALAEPSSRADTFFDWTAEGTPGSVAPVAGFVVAPNLNDSTADAVVAYFNAHPGTTYAVKVRDGITLSASTINKIYNQFNVQYTFADYESNSAQISSLRQMIQNSTVTGPNYNAGSSYIGNFNYATIPNGNDPSAAGGRPTNTLTAFRNAGLNMSQEVIYPGDGSFKTPADGSSNAPNLRSSLFTLPITRFDQAQQSLGSSTLHIPYITRFNNYNNPTMQNSSVLVNGVPQGAFTPGIAMGSLSAAQTANQMLSRDDFQAMVAHYRMRGATSFQLLDPGVVGYTQTQFQQDAVAGWHNSAIDSVFAHSNPMPANLQGATVTLDGATVAQSIESAGVVWSALTSGTDVGADTKLLAVLISNLSPSSHIVNIATRINGGLLSGGFTVASGAHQMLLFHKGTGSRTWILDSNLAAFNDPTLASNSDVGIPEPTSVSLLLLSGLGVLVRRRRRN